ncbi:hypothetical protein AAFF_G00364890 [Aldrovandia affinis]|uniref:ZNF380 coiled-coil domain-containing protein n=1 Tax=Aldrovandia affinis TaxID=143900 RepID=A0AAD7SIL8_9TELE|nr:hypothetical protein AAFF_G00364890 [Aldrovandia affinis]
MSLESSTKRKLLNLKKLNSPIRLPSESLLKRKTSNPENPQLKKLKADTDVDSCTLGIPADKFERNVGQKTAGSSKSGLGVLLGNSDIDDDDDDDIDNEHNKEDDDMDQGGGETCHDRQAVQKSAELPSVKAPGLPADFFDSSFPSGSAVSHSGSVLKADEQERPVTKKENTAEALPEGFFDDPVTDAKVRKVDAPKDQMDKEWDEFQKEIRQVNNASEAIVAEDDEEGRLERQIDEIDEQIECYRRVEVLREKQDLLEKKVGACDLLEGESSEDDEDQLLQLLSRDWRAKGALS